MGLVKYIIDLGKPVAYYPNLKRVTESTTATILLCQLIYWSDKTKDDGWIWKNSDELEIETGLTYNEQRTARKILLDKGIIEEVNVRSRHRTKFRVKEDVLNTLWDGVFGVTRKNKEPIRESAMSPANNVQKNIDVMGNLPVESDEEVLEIKNAIRRKLKVNPAGKRWETFIDFVRVRKEKAGEDLGTFIEWALSNGFDARYWTPEKMITLYPQAFSDDSEGDGAFIDLIPQFETKGEASPMPKDLRISSDWTVS